jgi:uncharacterized protein
MNRILRITGTGKISVTPDLANISFPVSTTKKNYKSAILSLNEKVNLLRDIVSKNGIDKNLVKTSDYNVHRETRYNEDTEEYDFVGFKASHSMSLELPLDNKLLNSLLMEIAESFRELDFSLRFTAKETEEHKQQLMESAIQNARASAEIIAKASGVELKEILHIDFSFSEHHIRHDYHMDASSMMIESNAMSEITPEDIDEEKNITVTWRIE